MARKRTKAYPLEFRQKVVELARSGRLPDDLAAEFEVARQTVRNWIKQSDLIAVAAAMVYPAKSESN